MDREMNRGFSALRSGNHNPVALPQAVSQYRAFGAKHPTRRATVSPRVLGLR